MARGIAKGAIPGKGKPQCRSGAQRRGALNETGRRMIRRSGDRFADKITRYFNKLAREPQISLRNLQA